MGQIVAADIGNGNAVAMTMGTKRAKSVSVPSVRARITSRSLGKGYELKATTAEWKGDTYAVGDDVLELNRMGADRHMGTGRYGGELHQFLTAYTLARIGIKSGRVDLTLMCPPAMYNELKPDMVKIYQSNPVKIKLKGDETEREWAYESVTVYPEGYTATACFMFDANGQRTPDVAEKIMGTVVLLDTGAFTTNVFRIQNTTFNQADLPQSSIQFGGGNTHIRMPLLEWVQSAGGDLAGVSIDDIDRTLRLGSATDEYMLQFGTRSVDIKPKLDELGNKYANWLANQLETRYGGGLESITGILVVGGNAPYILPHFKNWYTEKKVIDYKFAGLHPADLNAAGGLRLAMARMAAKK